MKHPVQPNRLIPYEPKNNVAVPFICPPHLRGTWTKEDGDSAEYKLLVSCARWFDERNEIVVDYKEREHHIDMVAGSTKVCSKNYWAQSLEVLNRLQASAPDVAIRLTALMAAIITSADDADLKVEIS